MDLIKDRLSHILRAKNLTATQFAEMMQIQPSNVSHLLSGRNKPSLDFLIKLKATFPEYSFDWIILGKKPITNYEPTIRQSNELFNGIKDEEHFDYNLFDNHDNVQIDKPSISNAENENNVSEKTIYRSLKQIIYVYDDHTFEIYDKRP